MIILHAAEDGGRLLLWGEAPAGDTPAPTPAGPSEGQPATRPLPFDAGSERLSAAVREVLPGWAAPRGKSTAFAWLPTIDGRPVPSSPLIGEAPPEGGSPVLAPWEVTVFPLSAGQAADLLCVCLAAGPTLHAGILAGPTLQFWAQALRLAGALVAREQFVPSVRRRDDDWQACWRPLLAGRDGQRFARLARTMPAACRALSLTAEAAPSRPAGDALSVFLDGMVDVLVRLTATVAALARAPARRRPSSKIQELRPEFASIHDQWLHALTTANGTLTGSPAELSQLAEQVRAWQRPVAGSLGAPFRLCFRLEEPAADGEGDGRGKGNSVVTVPRGAWQVRYLLQAQDDPSLLLPAEDAWSPTGEAARVLRRPGFQPREFMLTSLGQAADLCKPVEASLKQAAPGGFSTDARGAHEFLTQTAWLLEQAGFGVLLPSWWTRTGTRQRLTARAEVTAPSMQPTGSGLTMDQLIRFDWKVALGDELLSRRDLEALARLKVPLVQVRGQWVQVSAEEIQAALAFWKKKGTGEATLREIVQMALGSGRAPGGLPFGGVSARGWVGDFLGRLEGKVPFEELPPPEGFHGTLRPYQVRGYSWLAFLRQWGLGACLADDMGLGKTIQTLAVVQRDWHEQHRPTLLICPTSVVGNWKKEAERFTPDLPVLVHHGLRRVRGTAFAKQVADQALVLSSYALLYRDRAAFEQVEWAGVVLDEAQNIKNPDTKQAQAARALKAGYRAALTGTPVENHVGDLWSIFEFLNPGLLGGQTEFRRNFFVPIQAQRDAEAAERLKRLTGPFLLRRLKTDKSVIADLPEKQEMKVYCNLTREQASLYEAVVEQAQADLKSAEGIKRKGIILGLLTKLKQVCNHPAHFLGDNSPLEGRSGKLARLTEMLEEVLAEGDRALIFTQFTEMGGLLQKHLQETFGREVPFLHGGVSAAQRDRLVARFQEAGGAPFFLLSLKAGGTGLNLTAASHVFHFDRWWNPAVENQATDRAFRIGQTRNVQVHKFVCVGTLEEKIDEMIERKEAVASRVVGSGEGWLTELTNEELRDLLALRQDAVGE
jgi:superfamily II DNA or RNA helicase